jgi:hypothetical protein
MIEKWDAEHEDKIVKSPAPVALSQTKVRLALVIEKIASPVWFLYRRFVSLFVRK